MDINKFNHWLRSSGRQKSTIQNRISNCKNVERHEGDLDVHFNNDGGKYLLARLEYSAEDERNNTKPKHNIPISGNIRKGTATLKQAVKLYMDFKKENADNFELKTNTLAQSRFSNNESNNLNKARSYFRHENDLKEVVISQINDLFPHFQVYGANKGIEYNIEDEKIDILLEKNDGSLLALVLIAGEADSNAISQVLMYMGMLTDKFPYRNIQGCIIAGKIDNSLRNAAKTITNVSLKTYQINLELRNE